MFIRRLLLFFNKYFFVYSLSVVLIKKITNLYANATQQQKQNKIKPAKCESTRPQTGFRTIICIC